MEFDYSKLKGKIREKFGIHAKFSKEIGISNASLSNKLQGKSDFSHSEILLICKKLDINTEEIHDYFFTQKS